MENGIVKIETNQLEKVADFGPEADLIEFTYDDGLAFIRIISCRGAESKTVLLKASPMLMRRSTPSPTADVAAKLLPGLYLMAESALLRFCQHVSYGTRGGDHYLIVTKRSVIDVVCYDRPDLWRVEI